MKGTYPDQFCSLKTGKRTLLSVLFVSDTAQPRTTQRGGGGGAPHLELRGGAAVRPSPATHAIWTGLKAGEAVYLIYRVYKTPLDTI